MLIIFAYKTILLQRWLWKPIQNTFIYSLKRYIVIYMIGLNFCPHLHLYTSISVTMMHESRKKLDKTCSILKWMRKKNRIETNGRIKIIIKRFKWEQTSKILTMIRVVINLKILNTNYTYWNTSCTRQSFQWFYQHVSEVSFHPHAKVLFNKLWNKNFPTF